MEGIAIVDEVPAAERTDVEKAAANASRILALSGYGAVRDQIHQQWQDLNEDLQSMADAAAVTVADLQKLAEQMREEAGITYTNRAARRARARAEKRN